MECHKGQPDHLLQVSSETSSLKMVAPEEDDDDASAEWLATQFYDLHPEDPRQWQPTDAALQDGFGVGFLFTQFILHWESGIVHDGSRVLITPN